MLAKIQRLNISGAKTAAPITYKLLKESLVPTKETRKDSYEDLELDAEFFKPFEGDIEGVYDHQTNINIEDIPGTFFFVF